MEALLGYEQPVKRKNRSFNCTVKKPSKKSTQTACYKEKENTSYNCTVKPFEKDNQNVINNIKLEKKKRFVVAKLLHYTTQKKGKRDVKIIAITKKNVILRSGKTK